MDAANLFATMAGICMAVCQIPQAEKIIRTKSTENISVLMQVILTLGITFWFIAGVLMDSAPMYLSNGFCALLCYPILFVCFRNEVKRRKNLKK